MLGFREMKLEHLNLVPNHASEASKHGDFRFLVLGGGQTLPRKSPIMFRLFNRMS